MKLFFTFFVILSSIAPAAIGASARTASAEINVAEKKLAAAVTRVENLEKQRNDAVLNGGLKTFLSKLPLQNNPSLDVTNVDQDPDTTPKRGKITITISIFGVKVAEITIEWGGGRRTLSATERQLLDMPESHTQVASPEYHEAAKRALGKVTITIKWRKIKVTIIIEWRRMRSLREQDIARSILAKEQLQLQEGTNNRRMLNLPHVTELDSLEAVQELSTNAKEIHDSFTKFFLTLLETWSDCGSECEAVITKLSSANTDGGLSLSWVEDDDTRGVAPNNRGSSAQDYGILYPVVGIHEGETERNHLTLVGDNVNSILEVMDVGVDCDGLDERGEKEECATTVNDPAVLGVNISYKGQVADIVRPQGIVNKVVITIKWGKIVIVITFGTNDYEGGNGNNDNPLTTEEYYNQVRRFLDVTVSITFKIKRWTITISVSFGGGRRSLSLNGNTEEEQHRFLASNDPKVGQLVAALDSTLANFIEVFPLRYHCLGQAITALSNKGETQEDSTTKSKGTVKFFNESKGFGFSNDEEVSEPAKATNLRGR
jgi:hypothetical protein